MLNNGWWWWLIPSGYVKIAIENGHRNSELSIQPGDFPQRTVTNYQRVTNVAYMFVLYSTGDASLVIWMWDIWWLLLNFSGIASVIRITMSTRNLSYAPYLLCTYCWQWIDMIWNIWQLLLVCGLEHVYFSI